jgi:predicted glycoside hydrolase/deacetylase ChbG (UPF0249 family)
VPSLLAANGHFLPLGRLLLRLSAGAVRLLELEREIAAQFQRALALGAALDHVDGHHHVHVHPTVLPVVLKQAAAHGVPAVRCPEEPSPQEMPETLRDRGRRLATGAAARRLRPRARGAGLAVPDHFRGLALGLAFDTPALLTTLATLAPGVTELMCHPGYPDAELAGRSSYAAGRERELTALRAPSVRAHLRAREVELVSFRATLRPGPGL